MTGIETRARDLSEAFRETHNFGDGPVGDLFELVGGLLGCDVLIMESPDDEHGFSIYDGAGKTSVIAVTATPHLMRQRCSVGHELGHVLAGDLPGPNIRVAAEVAATAFAWHLLLPLSAVQRRAAAVDDAEELLGLLVREFGLSPELAAIQMAGVQVVTRAVAEQLGLMRSQQLAARFGWLSQYEAMATASQQERAPQRLMLRAGRDSQRGPVSVEEIALWPDKDGLELRIELTETDLASEPGGVADDGPLAPLSPPAETPSSTPGRA